MTIQRSMLQRYPSFLVLFGLACLMTACTPHLKTDAVIGAHTYLRQTDVITGGFQRSYRVHVPAGYDGRTRLPLVVVIHGAFDTAEGMETYTGFSQLADRETFIAMYPNGIGVLGFLQHWNAGHCCGKAADDGIDDVGFIAAAIEDVGRYLAVDRQRIYMVGFSNGGMMTYRFAAERGAMLAAAAPMAASIAGRSHAAGDVWRIPKPIKSLPLLIMHGMADDDIPFEGGRSRHRGGERTYWSVEDSVDFWVRSNGCSTPPTPSASAGGHIRIRTWDNCDGASRVVLYQLDGWGHVWPGPYFTDALPDDAPLKHFDAAEVVWQFFRMHSNP